MNTTVCFLCKRPCLLVLVVLMVSLKNFAQNDDTIPVYININNVQETKVYEVKGTTVGIEYHDYKGQLGEILLSIYDGQRNLITTLKLNKSFGLNNFLLNLDEIGGTWVMGKTYLFKFTIENNEVMKLLVKLSPKLLNVNPSVDLIVNPVQFSCDNLSAKLVDFYGVIEGGRAPYTTRWYVINDEKTDFLYQPREEKITNPGQTMVISIDKSPDYFVMLYVTDACGNTEKKMVHVVCEDGTKKINSVFIEPLNKTLIDKLNANKN